MAVTPDSQFLYAASLGSNDISAFRIGLNGALTPVAGSPFAAGNYPRGIKVSPDGKFLALAVSGRMAMFSIGADGTLTPVAGSPFSLGGVLDNVTVAINCASDLLFTSGSGLGPTTVDVLAIASNGALTPVAGSPVIFGGTGSPVAVLSPDDQHLFVSNFDSRTITSLNVAAGGGLTEVEGSPFANPGLDYDVPFGLATTQAGDFLYVANPHSRINGFSIATDGTLIPVPDSPILHGCCSWFVVSHGVST